MKFLTFAFCSLLIFCCHLCAQPNNWTVKAGQEIKDALSPNVKFRYPKFILGNVYFKDGTNSQAPLDFNLLNEEMQFINSNGDTLAIDDEATIKYVTINNDTFYYSKGYLELVTGNPFAKIAKKQKLKIGDIKKMGGYDQPSSVSAITTINSLYNGTQVSRVSSKADILLLKEITYYISDNYNRFEEANKKNVIKMFGRQETSIETFLSENKIKFNNENDLKKLINFLQKNL